MPIVPEPKWFYRLKATVSVLIETDDITAATNVGFDLLDKIRNSGAINGVAHSSAELSLVSFEAESKPKGGA